LQAEPHKIGNENLKSSTLHIDQGFFRTSCLISLIVLLGLIIQDYITQQPTSILIEVAACLLIVVIYFLAKNIDTYKKLLLPFIVSLYGLMTAYFILENGSGISPMIIFFLLFVFLFIVIPGRYRIYLILVTIVKLMLIFRYKLGSEDPFDQEVYSSLIIHILGVNCKLKRSVQ